MSSRVTIPDGHGDVPVLDGALFPRVVAILADRGAPPRLPNAAEARGEPVPLVVIDRPDVFAAGVLLRAQFGRAVAALRSRTVEFTVVTDTEVSVDLGDGSGARPAAPGDTLPAEYTAAVDAARITVQRDGRVARCAVPFDAAPAPLPADTLTVPGGRLWILPAPGHNALRCPLVVIEGFPGDHGFLFSHDVLAQHGLLASLQALGHDLVVLGLADGTRPLRENAAVVRAALAQVAERTELPVTLLGWSMGGLLARIAVAGLEADGEPHRVETLVTWDTPHRGTMTQLGVQWFVQRFSAAHPPLVMQQRLLESSANREMDMLVVGASAAAVDPARASLMADLAWPRRPRRILLASGRGDGRCSLEPGQVLLHWRREAHGEITLRALGGAQPLGAGWTDGERPAPLEVSGEPNWDGAPGGRATYVGEVAALLVDLVGGRVRPARPDPTCVVPTVSALDLDAAPDTPVSQRADLIACDSDQPHVAIDAQAAARVRDAIGGPFDPDRFDPHDPGFLADPFPTYARFRAFAPVHHVSAYGSLWCFRAADCRAILEDTETWLKHAPGADPVPAGPMSALAGLPPGLFSSDPPAHPVLREAVELPLRGALGAVPEIARGHAERLLAELEATERIELVQDYALPLPAHVLLDLLGIAQEPVLRMSLIAWQQAITLAHDVSQSPAVRLQGATCVMALRGFFAGLAQSHRKAPQPGLVGELCDAFAAAGLGDAELVGTLCDLLVAGYLSTTFIIATGAWRLLSASADLDPLRASLDGATAAVEELLRLDGPVQVIDRFAGRATTLSGRDVPAGTKATAVIGSADRDPDLVGSPDQVRLDRKTSHMAFGAGIHLCVGAPLARLVAPVALQALLEFAPSLELDGEPQWQTDPYLRAAISVPVALGSRSH